MRCINHWYHGTWNVLNFPPLTPDPYVAQANPGHQATCCPAPQPVASKKSHTHFRGTTGSTVQQVIIYIYDDDIYLSIKYTYIHIYIYIIYGFLALPGTSRFFYFYPWAARKKKGFGFESCWRVENSWNAQVARADVQERKENIYAFCPQKAIKRQLGMLHSHMWGQLLHPEGMSQPNLPQIQFLSHRCPSQLKPRKRL